MGAEPPTDTTSRRRLVLDDGDGGVDVGDHQHWTVLTRTLRHTTFVTGGGVIHPGQIPELVDELGDLRIAANGDDIDVRVAIRYLTAACYQQRTVTARVVDPLTHPPDNV